ncbi:dihydrofolate reductase family protein [Actinomadura flavalba]|uniref:dihydrofolate reductase family protein n=1 Tax=Actinomadura flavalba TaxID=1120938 RepID=UPI000371AD04|nr:dihydrofolate reductase family protein [Actinomadura flavalba]
MRKLVYYIGVSLDGYIAGPGGEFDFYPQGEGERLAAYRRWMTERFPEAIPTRFRPQIGMPVDAPNRGFDTILMGLATYRADPGVTSPYAHLRQYVVSTSLGSTGEPDVTLIDSDPLPVVRDLKEEDGLNIWLCGGGKLAGALLPEIDELVLKQYPVVAGGGIPVFDGPFSPTEFQPDESRAFDNGVRVAWYSRR